MSFTKTKLISLTLTTWVPNLNITDKKGILLFPLPKIKRDIKGDRSLWIHDTFDDSVDYWKERWAIPRAERRPEWKNFATKRFFDKTQRILKSIPNG